MTQHHLCPRSPLYGLSKTVRKSCTDRLWVSAVARPFQWLERVSQSNGWESLSQCLQRSHSSYRYCSTFHINPTFLPHTLLAVSPVLIYSCSAVQSFCVHSVLSNAAMVIPSDAAKGHCLAGPFLPNQSAYNFTRWAGVRHSHHRVQKVHA